MAVIDAQYEDRDFGPEALIDLIKSKELEAQVVQHEKQMADLKVVQERERAEQQQMMAKVTHKLEELNRRAPAEYITSPRTRLTSISICKVPTACTANVDRIHG